MEHFFSYACIVPSRSVSNESLRSLWEYFSAIPHSNVMPLTDDESPHGTFDQFKGIGGGANITVNFVELWFGGTMNADMRRHTTPPEGLDLILLDAPDYTYIDLPEQLDGMAEVLRDISERADALYGIGISSDYFDQRGTNFDSILEAPGGLMYISRSVLDRLERFILPLPEVREELKKGLWLRYGEDYIYGMGSEDRERFSSIIPQLKKAIHDVRSA